MLEKINLESIGKVISMSEEDTNMLTMALMLIVFSFASGFVLGEFVGRMQ